MMISSSSRKLLAPAITAAAVALLLLVGAVSTVSTIGPAQTPPLAPELQLGNPTGLTAAPGPNPGEIALRWTPASNATLHLVYLVAAGSVSGSYHLAPGGDVATETVANLHIGQPYWFIVIAGRPGTNGGPFQWSQWSNWVQATPALSALPALPPLPGTTPTTEQTGTTPTASPTRATTGSNSVEIEGAVVSINAQANTFTVWVDEYEYFGSNRPSNPLTVDYSAVERVESWLLPGQHIEAEGSYDANAQILSAYEVELDDRNGSDGSSGDDNNEAASVYNYVEVEGTVVSINTQANTFTVWVDEYEYFGSNRPSNPLTVDYGAVEHVESWLLSGHYIEAEGSYDASAQTLRAYEVEPDDRDRDSDSSDDDQDSSDNDETADYGYVEVEGTVVSVNTQANTFTVWVDEYEYFGANRPSNPLTVDYGAVERIESWLLPGRYIEAEGSYDATTQILRAYEVEPDDRDSDDDDDDNDGG